MSRPSPEPSRPSALPSAPTSMGSPRGVPVPCTATYRTASVPILAPSRHALTSACMRTYHLGFRVGMKVRPGAFPSRAPYVHDDPAEFRERGNSYFFLPNFITLVTQFFIILPGYSVNNQFSIRANEPWQSRCSIEISVDSTGHQAYRTIHRAHI